ncbi:hypothetical protein B0H67DRAFT_557205 [Lasiosphaeris hirsuta]|uniref:Uncharacterized protein n=1 Tax=Lasiosphaeris hirsuta TaxID=260670 RepID=A0AA39ZVK7_9PEZI|nr:hypothetical protein B0H67DRAFT_557205 [Lasiosphaeris hirsuta]
MLKKLTCSVLLLPLVILLNGAMLAIEVIMLRAGTGSLDNHSHLPFFHAWYTVLIDTDQYKYAPPGQDGSDPYGLPDSYDYSKHKDFFAIFPAVYCSGKKVAYRQGKRYDHDADYSEEVHGGYRYEADYCSPWGSQFDLQRLWRVWGVDLIEDNYIGQNPRMIYLSLIIGACTTALSAILKVFGYCYFYSKVAACIVSWVSMACLCTTSATSQTFASKLASGASRLEVSGEGHISAQLYVAPIPLCFTPSPSTHAVSGNMHNGLSWGLFGASLASALAETFIVWRQWKLRRTRRPSSPGGRGRATAVGGGHGHSVYQHLVAGKDGMGLHAESHIELTHSRSRGPSRELSPMRGNGGYGDGAGVTAQGSAYEPMRHRDVG